MKTYFISTAIKRLDRLEKRREQSKWVALFPPIPTVQEWEDMASQSQAILKENVKV